MITENLKPRLTFIKLLSPSALPWLVTIIQYPIYTGAGAEHNLDIMTIISWETDWNWLIIRCQLLCNIDPRDVFSGTLIHWTHCGTCEMSCVSSLRVYQSHRSQYQLLTEREETRQREHGTVAASYHALRTQHCMLPTDNHYTDMVSHGKLQPTMLIKIMHPQQKQESTDVCRDINI